MSAFRKIPELDWLKSLAEEYKEFDDNSARNTVKQLQTVYRYLLWLRRANLATPQTVEHTMAMGLSTKYHRRLYNVPINDFEQRYIAEAEALFQKVKRGEAG
jgi:hypothetical protein